MPNKDGLPKTELRSLFHGIGSKPDPPNYRSVSGRLAGWVAHGFSRGGVESKLDSRPPPLKKWATPAKVNSSKQR